MAVVPIGSPTIPIKKITVTEFQTLQFPHFDRPVSLEHHKSEGRRKRKIITTFNKVSYCLKGSKYKNCR
jgi:hypothetical protein